MGGAALLKQPVVQKDQDVLGVSPGSVLKVLLQQNHTGPKARGNLEVPGSLRGGHGPKALPCAPSDRSPAADGRARVIASLRKL